MPNLLKKSRSLPQESGCYIMRNSEGDEIYVGKAVNLRRRVTSYFQKQSPLPKQQALLCNISDFTYIVTQSEIEALLLESRLIKDLQPKYNFLLKNNEAYPGVEITMGEDFPQVLITRQQRKNKSRYFGPFTSGTELRSALNILGKIFKFRTCGKKITVSQNKRRFIRPCLNYHIGRCTGPCAGLVAKKDYRRQIQGICLFFKNKRKDLITTIKKEMEQAAQNLRFEKAAELRDRLTALENINNAPHLSDELSPIIPVIEPKAGLNALQKILKLPTLPRRIEGIDIANLQGREVVGAVVTFFDAIPFKDNYRRYRIKTVEGQDDYKCIAEVVTRRYKRLLGEKKEKPDLILIDGGPGQLHAAEEALKKIKFAGTCLLSLAKKEEILHICGSSQPLNLVRRNAGLKLLMYVRDEAHRFAQHYHHILRKKALLG